MIVRIVMLLALVATLGCDKDDGGMSASTIAATRSIGVAQCDDYLTKYDECVSNKVPASERKALQQSAAQMRTSWEEAARNPSVRQGLANGCSRALEAAKQTMAAYHCSW